MKLFNMDEDRLNALMAVVDSCNGAVHLRGDGLDLNLKSKLTQYFALVQLFSGGEVEEMIIEADEDADTAKLVKFLINGLQ